MFKNWISQHLLVHLVRARKKCMKSIWLLHLFGFQFFACVSIHIVSNCGFFCFHTSRFHGSSKWKIILRTDQKIEYAISEIIVNFSLSIDWMLCHPVFACQLYESSDLINSAYVCGCLPHQLTSVWCVKMCTKLIHNGRWWCVLLCAVEYANRLLSMPFFYFVILYYYWFDSLWCVSINELKSRAHVCN